MSVNGRQITYKDQQQARWLKGYSELYSQERSAPSDFFEDLHKLLFMTGLDKETLCFGLVSFVSWHINLCRLFNAKAILLEEQ